MNDYQFAALMWAIQGCTFVATALLAVGLHADSGVIVACLSIGGIASFMAAKRWSDSLSLSERQG